MRTLADAPVSINSDKTHLETPVLLVDLDTMEKNIEDYATVADEAGVTLRSHIKSHKNIGIAHMQDDRTGGGVLCQKLSEAEVMAQGGIKDIYLSYMVVEESKLHRLAALSEKVEYFATTVDGTGNIDPLQRVAAEHDTTINVVLELDIGVGRVGIEPGSPALGVAREIGKKPNLELDSVMAYEGHIGYGDTPARTADEYEQRCMDAMDRIAETIDLLEDDGFRIQTVMAGSTATAKYSAEHPVVTEIHPGMYPFYDSNLLDCMPDVTKEDCAATVLTTVISKPTDDRVIVDAGSKSMSFDMGPGAVPKHRDDLHYYNKSEEHGWIDTSEAETPLSVGDKIEFIVPHICTTINLHEYMIATRNGAVEDLFEVHARGKVR